jgi:hypothetical protein
MWHVYPRFKYKSVSALWASNVCSERPGCQGNLAQCSSMLHRLCCLQFATAWLLMSGTIKTLRVTGAVENEHDVHISRRTAACMRLSRIPVLHCGLKAVQG